MARVLVTGGAGFIGRWVVEKLLSQNHRVLVLDDLSNGSRENLSEFSAGKTFMGLARGDVSDAPTLSALFSKNRFDVVVHLAAQIDVQESIESPAKSMNSNILGTFALLEEMKKQALQNPGNKPKMVLVSTCMVYDMATGRGAIAENHPLKPGSPYAATKLASEFLVQAYGNSFSMPYVILRPFNTYGPFQKSGAEGGVVSIFIKNKLDGLPLRVFGSGEQTRDFLYVEDCAEFIVRAAFSRAAEGKTLNAGSGKETSINSLAEMVSGGKCRILHVPHHHPQAEIMNMRCGYSLAEKILGWKPGTNLKDGLRKTRQWLEPKTA